MKHLSLALLLISFSFLSCTQKIKNSITILEKKENGTFIQKEKLEEKFDKKERIKQATYTDLTSKLNNQKEYSYEYNGEGISHTNLYYFNDNTDSAILYLTIARIKKSENEDTHIEKSKTERTKNRYPFYYRSKLENFISFDIEEEGSIRNEKPFDTTLFNVPIRLPFTDGYGYTSIEKTYSNPINNVYKAKFEYYKSSQSDTELSLSTIILFEKSEDGTLTKSHASFSPSTLTYYIEETKLINTKEEIIKEWNTTYKYEYDKHGNWTSKVEIDKDGNITYRTIRTIKYQ